MMWKCKGLVGWLAAAVGVQQTFRHHKNPISKLYTTSSLSEQQRL